MKICLVVWVTSISTSLALPAPPGGEEMIWSNDPTKPPHWGKDSSNAPRDQATTLGTPNSQSGLLPHLAQGTSNRPVDWTNNFPNAVDETQLARFRQFKCRQCMQFCGHWTIFDVDEDPIASCARDCTSTFKRTIVDTLSRIPQPLRPAAESMECLPEDDPNRELGTTALSPSPMGRIPFSKSSISNIWDQALNGVKARFSSTRPGLPPLQPAFPFQGRQPMKGF